MLGIARKEKSLKEQAEKKKGAKVKRVPPIR